MTQVCRCKDFLKCFREILRESKRIHEAVSNLPAATIANLQCNGDCRATVQ